jgi:hypothetical protein
MREKRRKEDSNGRQLSQAKPNRLQGTKKISFHHDMMIIWNLFSFENYLNYVTMQ